MYSKGRKRSRIDYGEEVLISKSCLNIIVVADKITWMNDELPLQLLF